MTWVVQIDEQTFYMCGLFRYRMCPSISRCKLQPWTATKTLSVDRCCNADLYL